MIISFKHNFCFIKTHKTAGTSIEIALSQHCGPNDIITPISPSDEAIRRSLGYRGPQNYKQPWREMSPRQAMAAVVRGRRRRYWNHISAGAVKRYLGDATWDDLFTFCFERNPWDKVVSFFYFRRGEYPGGIPDLLASEMLKKICDWNNYTVNDSAIVDKVYHYEQLSDAVDEIGVRLGLKGSLALPRAKGAFRESKGSYHDHYDDHTANRVADIFAKEREAFGYTF